ncbi:MAG: TRAP transporter large permease subunit [Deltaproteobacteria bacterium]|nr:TRAP transporter large permease subunit [Deltaproteobacteria bacterium]
MDPTLISIIMIVCFLALMAAGVPVFAALGVAGIVGILLLQGTRGLGAVPGVIYDRLGNFTLVAVPLFILMGEVIFVTGVGSDIYTAAGRWLNRFRGGLSMASVAASAVFGAMCGVSVAGAASIGSFAIPEMLKRGYEKSLATGCVAAAGALSLLIPPSVAFILYGVVADESVGKLFIGGIVPGVILALMMMAYIWTICKVRPYLAPASKENVTWKMRFASLARIWPSLVLIFLVLGSIYFGIATPTEAAAVGCAGSLALGLYRKTLNWKTFRRIFRETAVNSGMIILILTSALLFGYVLTLLMLPQQLAELVGKTNLPTWAVLSCIMALLILMGMFMDIVSVILISTPILLPIVTTLGYNTLWFGIVMCITCEIAVITPPVGLNLYVIKGISPSHISLEDIIRGAAPFVLVEIVCLAIFVSYPPLSLWLPGKMY